MRARPAPFPDVAAAGANKGLAVGMNGGCAPATSAADAPRPLPVDDAPPPPPPHSADAPVICMAVAMVHARMSRTLVAPRL